VAQISFSAWRCCGDAMPLTVVEEINFGTLSMQVASAAVEDGDWQMAREALSEACMQAMRALHAVDQRLDGATSSKGTVQRGVASPCPLRAERAPGLPP
jgi:hypothetical protein